MTEHDSRLPGDAESPERQPSAETVARGHEAGRENARLILRTAAIVVVSAIVIHLAVWWLFELFQSREDKDKRGQFPLAAEENRRDPEARIEGIHEPRLEGIEGGQGARPYVHADDVRARRDPRLTGYAWVEKGRVARIPIDQAMAAMAEKDRLRAGTDKDTGAYRRDGAGMPSPSNSGRGRP